MLWRVSNTVIWDKYKPEDSERSKSISWQECLWYTIGRVADFVYGTQQYNHSSQLQFIEKAIYVMYSETKTDLYPTNSSVSKGMHYKLLIALVGWCVFVMRSHISLDDPLHLSGRHPSLSFCLEVIYFKKVLFNSSNLSLTWSQGQEWAWFI